MSLRPTEPLSSLHPIGAFNSGVEVLDRWLQIRGLPNQAAGFARTFVLLEGDALVGYYALAAGSVGHEGAIGRLRRNGPDPVPMVVLARLAVAADRQGTGIGAVLVKDALRRTSQAAELIGIRGVLAHAKSAAARDFYLALGFGPSPVDPMTLMTGIRGL